jgi:hypothetical protein
MVDNEKIKDIANKYNVDTKDIEKFNGKNGKNNVFRIDDKQGNGDKLHLGSEVFDSIKQGVLKKAAGGGDGFTNLEDMNRIAQEFGIKVENKNGIFNIGGIEIKDSNGNGGLDIGDFEAAGIIEKSVKEALQKKKPKDLKNTNSDEIPNVILELIFGQQDKAVAAKDFNDPYAYLDRINTKIKAKILTDQLLQKFLSLFGLDKAA